MSLLSSWLLCEFSEAGIMYLLALQSSANALLSTDACVAVQETGTRQRPCCSGAPFLWHAKLQHLLNTRQVPACSCSACRHLCLLLICPCMQ